MDEYLEHYGTPRHSGRFPWGSGKDPYQRSVALKKYVNELKKEGLTEKQIAKGLGFKSVKQYRSFVTISNSEIKKQQYYEASKLKEKGWSNQAIGEHLKPPMTEGSVRNLLDPERHAKAQVLDNTVQALKDGLEKGKYIDLGEGTGLRLGVSETMLDAAKEQLRQEGYEFFTFRTMQQGTGKYTNMRVLCPPGTDFSTMYQNRDKIGLPDDWSNDGGYTLSHLQDPVRLARNRILVRYAEEGGEDRDGTVEIRRGVEDISLGDTHYAQVRIAVEGDRYMKGMAFYSDNIPEGYDIIYNTNKKKGSSDKDVFKEMKDDPDNPFGASVMQSTYNDADGKPHLSAINKVGAGEKPNEEGKWDEWSRKLPAQFLSKQPVPFAKKQLKLLYDSKEEEYEELVKLTNPVVKRQLLMEFADSCDSASVSMEAAALPRQATKVILPVTSLKDNEVYAPTYKDGEEVALVRFPHGAIFEIPVLTVNNKNKEGKSVVGQGIDGIGINYNVAGKLSGADFDGDTALVLPTSGQKIKSMDYPSELKEFNNKKYKLTEEEANAKYAKYNKDGVTGKTIDNREKQLQMGIVSNLITDMTVRGAPLDDLVKAVKHSMVVIDSEKHSLDWKQSEEDNDIAGLKKRWQIKENGKHGGASTLLSAGPGDMRVPTYKEQIDPTTGRKIKIDKPGDSYINREGRVVRRTVKRSRISQTDDAFTLSSGTKIEAVYAEHVNKLKELANSARREALATKNTPYSPSAKKTYAPEVSSLNSKLNEVLKNKPLERAAQAIAGKVVADKIKADPSLTDDKDKLSKLRNKAQAQARARTGAKRTVVDITDREWEAIQAGAVSSTALAKILSRADKTRVRQLATPKESSSLTPAMTARIKAFVDNGATLAEAAERFGVSPSTVNRALDAE